MKPQTLFPQFDPFDRSEFGPQITGDTLTAKVARLFLSKPNAWISMQELADIAGTGGWRTRKNECEHWYGMRIENRQRRETLADGRTVTISEYRFKPEGR